MVFLHSYLFSLLVMDEKHISQCYVFTYIPVCTPDRTLKSLDISPPTFSRSHLYICRSLARAPSGTFREVSPSILFEVQEWNYTLYDHLCIVTSGGAWGVCILWIMWWFPSFAVQWETVSFYISFVAASSFMGGKEGFEDFGSLKSWGGVQNIFLKSILYKLELLDLKNISVTSDL